MISLTETLLTSVNNEAKLTPELFIEAANIIADDNGNRQNSTM